MNGLRDMSPDTQNSKEHISKVLGEVSVHIREELQPLLEAVVRGDGSTVAAELQQRANALNDRFRTAVSRVMKELNDVQ